MDDSSNGCNVDEAVEAAPVFASHGAQDKGWRGDGKQEEDEPGEESHLDETALAEIVEDRGPDLLPLGDEFAGMAGAEAVERGGKIVAGEEEDVGGKMEAGVEESVEADETAEADEPGDPGREAADGSDGETGEDHIERPVAGEVGDVVDGVGLQGERAGGERVPKPEHGCEADEVSESFEENDGALGHGLACSEER